MGEATRGERHLFFEVAGQMLAIGASFLREVALPPVDPAGAGAGGGACGAFIYRGRAIPALDLRALFGYRGDPRGEGARVLVGECAGRPLGLIVDRVADVAELLPGTLFPIPEGASRIPPGCFRGVVQRGERVALVLEAEGLAGLDCVEGFQAAVDLSPGRAG